MNRQSLAVLRPRLTASSADDWFLALDQRLIGAGSNGWVAQVLGIHTERKHLWIQIAAAHNPWVSLVLRVSASTGLNDVLSALKHRRPAEETRLEVIDLSA